MVNCISKGIILRNNWRVLSKNNATDSGVVLFLKYAQNCYIKFGKEILIMKVVELREGISVFEFNDADIACAWCCCSSYFCCSCGGK